MEIIPYVAIFTFFVTALVIYNTIKLSVVSRKDLINTLQLIGASHMFVKIPFVIEGIFIGSISVILAFPAIFLTIEIINYIIINYSSIYLKFHVDVIMMIWALVIVTLISVIGSHRAASTFLK